MSLVLIDCSVVPSFSRLVCDDGFAELAGKDAVGYGAMRSDFSVVVDMVEWGEGYEEMCLFG